MMPTSAPDSVRLHARIRGAFAVLSMAALATGPVLALAQSRTTDATRPGTAAEALVGEAGRIDDERTRIGFTLKTRWGQVLRGRFPEYTGMIEALADGQRRVRLQLAARAVTIDDHPNYTRFTRGEGFFEAERYPEVSFVSEPYSAELLRAGGTLKGMLQIRETRRTERFQIEPSDCARPGVDCDVVAVGSVRRSDYGVDRWIFAVSDQVRFTLQLRLRPVSAEAEGAP